MKPIVVKSVITKKLIENGEPIHRHFFEWSERKNLKAITLRISFFDDSGKTLTTASMKLPAVKIKEMVRSKEGDLWVEKPLYDQTTFFYLDDLPTNRPVKFRYTAVTGLLTKSASTEAPMSEKYEDLSIYG